MLILVRGHFPNAAANTFRKQRENLSVLIFPIFDEVSPMQALIWYYITYFERVCPTDQGVGGCGDRSGKHLLWANDCSPFIPVVVTSLKMMNVPMISCKASQLEYSTKAMQKHKFYDLTLI